MKTDAYRGKNRNMAYLTESERENLLNELVQLNLVQAKRKLRWLDKDIKLNYYRNVQQTGEWITSYDLVGKGTRVILIEAYKMPEGGPGARAKADFELERVIVEPLPQNRT